MSSYLLGAFTEGSAVRLSVDQRPVTVGLIVDTAYVRASDDEHFVRVDFDPEGLTEPTILALSTLVPLCEHVTAFRDFDGAWAQMSCRFDADRLVTLNDKHSGTYTLNLCDHHSVEAARDLTDDRDVSFVSSHAIRIPRRVAS